MTTKLEKQFFKVFGIEPKKQGYCDWQSDCPYSDIKCGDGCPYWKYENELKYPEITDRILLDMICIYNSFQNDEASLFIPFDINNVKDIALQVITKSIKDKSLNNYYCNDVEKLKSKIQQLFKEEE